ncbi:hypothetical protein PR202_gb08511 [Eleusine coracana subsp. coracana]|uniref:CASP-like protein n=1 Tax=Eleusine coracana subsp. coracana TaxID=191504 RepID=A0AAV5EET2_ELECO|nr:hypothetical protein PR202_gb08511 [Eleusine coracana subsp. coracana]
MNNKLTPTFLTSALALAVTVQGLWSFMIGIVELYALMVKRGLRNRFVVCLFAIGDVITGQISFYGSCAAAGVIILMDEDLIICSGNHCPAFKASVAMAFMCFFSLIPTCFLNTWLMAIPR